MSGRRARPKSRKGRQTSPPALTVSALQAKAKVMRVPYTIVAGKKMRNIRKKAHGARRAAPAQTDSNSISAIVDRFDAAMAEVNACQELLAVHGLTATQNDEGITVLMRKKRTR